MRRQFILISACLCLFIGWTAAFSLRNLPPGLDLYWLIPTLIFSVGFGLLMKIVRWPLTAFAAVVSGCLSLFLLQTQNVDPLLVSLLRLHPSASPAGLYPVRLQVPDSLQTGRYAISRLLYVPKGWQIELVGVTEGHPRDLEFDPQGNLYASLPEAGQVVVFRTQGQQRQPVAAVFASELDRPSGLLWQGESLLVGQPSRLDRLIDTDNDMQADTTSTVVADLPEGEGHWGRALAADVQAIYMGIGSSCNACVESDTRRASILRIQPNTQRYSRFASGLRNPTALVVRSSDQTLWATDRSRTLPQGTAPGDEVNRIERSHDYGWPNCYNRQQPDPSWGTHQRCQQTRSPEWLLPPGFNPVGLAAATVSDKVMQGRGFFVTSHGVGDGRPESGYALYWLSASGSQNETSPVPIVVGWQFRGQIWGHPTAPTVGPDGALYLADQRNGGIYRLKAPEPIEEG